MSKFAPSSFLLIKVFAAFLLFLLLGSLVSVFRESNSLLSNISATRADIERIETDIMSKEECFPECSTQFNLNEQWVSLKARLTYYEKIQDESFIERLKTDIQVNDIWYVLAVLIFVGSLIFVRFRNSFSTKVTD